MSSCFTQLKSRSFESSVVFQKDKDLTGRCKLWLTSRGADSNCLVCVAFIQANEYAEVRELMGYDNRELCKRDWSLLGDGL